MKVPWYIHGNWKLEPTQLADLENNILKVGYFSNNLCTTYDIDCEELGFLKNFYKDRVDEIAKDQAFYHNSSYVYEFWVQLYNKNATHCIHTHFGLGKNVVISFVHFLRTTNTQCLRFTNTEEIEIPQQEEGDFIVFPSYVSHQVVTHSSNYNRIVVAGNIKILEHENQSRNILSSS
mgnify:FL=1